MKHPCLDRQVVCYPHPKYHKIFIAYCYVNCEKKAPMAESILKKFFDTLPESEQKKLLQTYDEMNEEERRFPNRESKNSY